MTIKDHYLALMSTPEGMRLVNDPFSFAAEIATGVMKVGKSGLMVSGGYIFQAALKGRLFAQVAKEIRQLQEKGQIPEDYLNRPYGQESVAELMDFIDEGNPDPQRFLAIKALFFAINDGERTDGERVLAHNLMRLARELSGMDLAVLGVYYQAFKIKASPTQADWPRWAAERLGISVTSVIQMSGKTLWEKGLVTQNVSSWQSMFTDLGLECCRWMEGYGDQDEASIPSHE
jgi:hypothetical protein